MDGSPDGPEERPQPFRRPGRRRVRLPLVVVLLVLLGVVTGDQLLRGAPPASGPQVVASFPVWNVDGGSRTVARYAESIGSASPNIYEVGPTGAVVLRPQPGRASVTGSLELLREHGARIVPIISNTRDGAWDPQLIETILHDPLLVQRHITAIVTLIREERFAGIDIDYEDLTSADRKVFSDFIARLADALHAEDRILTVDVFAKESDQGYGERNRAQDYRALGRAADQVRLMAYDFHWQSGPAGPIAPATWVRDVLAYAVGEIPPHKIVLGVPTYGYGWVGIDVRLVSWLQAYELSRDLGVPVRWDAAAESPWITFRDDQGRPHTIWFENTYSIRSKLELAHEYGIGGVFLWLVGDEDDGLWPVISEFAQGRSLQTGAPR
jgi:spore germination protein